jgi:hypothetical protein
MSARDELAAEVEAARTQFRRDLGIAPRYLRRAVARGIRTLAAVVGKVDKSAAEAQLDLADLVDVELEARSTPTPSLPPDKEGDEELAIRRGRISRDSL